MPRMMMSMGWLRRARRTQLVAHLDDGTSLKGWVDRVYRDALLLRPAQVLRPDADPVTVDGGALVPRSRVMWVQPLPGEVLTAEVTS